MFAPNHWESYCSERSRNVTAVGLLLVGAHPSPTRIKGHTHPLQHSQAAPMRVTPPPNLELSFPMYPAAFAATAPAQCQNEALNSLSPPLRRRRSSAPTLSFLCTRVWRRCPKLMRCRGRSPWRCPYRRPVWLPLSASLATLGDAVSAQCALLSVVQKLLGRFCRTLAVLHCAALRRGAPCRWTRRRRSTAASSSTAAASPCR